MRDPAVPEVEVWKKRTKEEGVSVNISEGKDFKKGPKLLNKGDSRGKNLGGEPGTGKKSYRILKRSPDETQETRKGTRKF